MTLSHPEAIHRYEGTDVSFVVPRAWQDRSIVAFSPSPSGKRAIPSFVVTRQEVAPEETLAAFAHRQLGGLQSSLRDFALHEHDAATVDGAPAESIELSWRAPTGRIVQQMIFVLVTGEAWLFTATAPEEEADGLRTTFARIVESLRLHRSGSSRPPPPDGAAPALDDAEQSYEFPVLAPGVRRERRER